MKSSVEKIKVSMKEVQVTPKVTIRASTDYSLKEIELLFETKSREKKKDCYNGCSMVDEIEKE